MFNSRKCSVVALSVALPLLGSQALAWSPLQHDCAGDIASPSGHSVYQEFIDKAAKEEANQQAQPATDNTAGADSTAGADNHNGASSSQPAQSQAAASDPEAAQQAQSAIENDATSATIDIAPGKPDEEKAQEIKPSRSPKSAGRMPNESLLDPQYFLKKAQSFVADGDFQSALNYVNKSLTLNADYWDAWYEKALIYQLSGYDAAAARRYLALLERKPDMLAAHIALGMLYRKHGNKHLAEGEYQKAIELNWHSFAAHYNLANLYMDEKRMDMALKEYQVCLKLKPNDAHVHNNIGVIYQHRHYLEEAQAEFTKASHLDPANQIFGRNLDNVRGNIGHRPNKLPL